MTIKSILEKFEDEFTDKCSTNIKRRWEKVINEAEWKNCQNYRRR